MVHHDRLSRLKNLWLCLPFALLSLCDMGITLYGQPASYWSGKWQTAHEAFPIFAMALHNGPVTFVLASLLWVLVFSAIIVWVLPRFFSEALALALVNGHTWGVMTWLVYVLRVNYYLALCFFLASAIVFILCYRRYQFRSPVA